jgi:hypothetical protein
MGWHVLTEGRGSVLGLRAGGQYGIGAGGKYWEKRVSELNGLEAATAAAAPFEATLTDAGTVPTVT